MKRIIAVGISILLLQNVFAITIRGVVEDKLTKIRLENAVVLALENNRVVATAESNSGGEFAIDLKKGKSIRLEVVKNGYKTENTMVEITKEFIDANPFLTIQLQKREAVKAVDKIAYFQENTEMEDIGNLSDLPEDYTIIEAIPVKEKEIKRTKFNAKVEVEDETTNVNVKKLKAAHEDEIEKEALSPNFNFSTSYFKDNAIYYNVGKAFLSEKVEKALEDVIKQLANGNQKLKITVFADANREKNIGEYVSKLRGETIVNFLMSKGVSFERLDVNLYGNQILNNKCYEGVDCTDTQHQENRRVELLLVE